MLLWVISVLLLNSSEVYPSALFTLDIGHKSRRSAASLQNSLLSFPQTTHVGIASSIAVDLSANLAQNNSLPVFTKIIRRVGHFRWLGPNVWWEISQFWIEYIKAHRTNVWWTMKVFLITLHCQQFVDKPPTESHSSCYYEEFMCCS